MLKKQIDMILPIIIIIIIFFLIYLVLIRRENFSRSIRYMWMYNPSSRNSSYDQRAEPISIKSNLKKVGIYYQPSLYGNETNYRVRKYYKKYQMDTPKDNKQFLTMEYKKK